MSLNRIITILFILFALFVLFASLQSVTPMLKSDKTKNNSSQITSQSITNTPTQIPIPTPIPTIFSPQHFSVNVRGGEDD